MLNIFAVILSLVFFLHSSAQSKWVFEQYNYIRQPNLGAFVPMIHLETRNNWYGELRYNYEDAQTVSLFAGKTFSGGSDLSYSITPMAGFSTGRFTGVTSATNIAAEWKKIYFSAQSQYSIATKSTATNFVFNWSELGYNLTDNVFTGLAMQYTRQQKENSFEPGFLAGLSFDSVSFPFYVFSPFNKGRYFVLGLNCEYNLKKPSKTKNQIVL